MVGLPASRVLVDLDCDALHLPKGGQRCDYVYFDEKNGTQRVAPIELKGGGFSGSSVAGQLQEGATIADEWIPRGTSFRLVPILIHGKGARKKEYERLRAVKISLRGHRAQVLLIRCGAPLNAALDRA